MLIEDNVIRTESEWKEKIRRDNEEYMELGGDYRMTDEDIEAVINELAKEELVKAE